MRQKRNILFIMFDQLRFDYLSCTGHPHLQTPNIDRLARQSLRFNRCYVQSPVCGASRMSFYTGRYVSSHGAAWNNVPLKVGEVTLGDHLRGAGMDAVLVGKTHMRVDASGMARLGLAPDSVIGARVAECGFDAFVRDDGLWGEGPDGAYDAKPSPYQAFLKSRGYDGENPWHDYANAGVDADGNIASGWLYENAVLPANIREEDSETPWLTREAIRFMQARLSEPEKPWLCHLSYIKPHWPYIVPAPYHDLYGPHHFLPANRHEDELKDPNPVYAAFAGNAIGQAFRKEEVRARALGAYMGLIKQIDDQMGVLFGWLEQSGLKDNTMIVITSDHGDYMGDHWLGEKDLFHDPSVKVPLIIHDPSEEADATRGMVSDALVESIDLAPTFLDFIGAPPKDEMLEGRSLMPFLHGQAPDRWRDYVISEYDFSASAMADALDLSPDDARLFMVADEKWKFIHAEGGLPPMLFDLENDPRELEDLGRNPAYAGIVEASYSRLFEWARRPAQRTTMSKAELLARRERSAHTGIILGAERLADIDPELMRRYTGPARQRYDKE